MYCIFISSIVVRIISGGSIVCTTWTTCLCLLSCIGIIGLSGGNIIMSYLLEIESYHMTVVLNGMSVIGEIVLQH